MSLARRIATAEKRYNGNADADAVRRCADYLYFAFLPTPLYAPRHGDGTEGFRSLIDRSGVAADGIPRALTLALARRYGADVGQVAEAVAAAGVDTVLAVMALPPAEREEFSRAEIRID